MAGIQNLNGVNRKNAVPLTGRPNSNVFKHDSAFQHPATGVFGTSYQSPFTSSSKPPLGTFFNTATLPDVPAMQVEDAGKVVHTKKFRKVQPHEKGASFVVSHAIKITSTKFSPSLKNDVPSNPNKPAPRLARPVRRPLTEPAKSHAGSFHSALAAGNTLSSHAPGDPSTSRWATVKRGAAG